MQLLKIGTSMDLIKVFSSGCVSLLRYRSHSSCRGGEGGESLSRYGRLCMAQSRQFSLLASCLLCSIAASGCCVSLHFLFTLTFAGCRNNLSTRSDKLLVELALFDLDHSTASEMYETLVWTPDYNSLPGEKKHSLSYFQYYGYDST